MSEQDQQIRIPADIVSDPEIIGDPAEVYAKVRWNQLTAAAGWHLRWKLQQVSVILTAMFQVVDSVALAVIRLVYALGSYGIVGTLMWNWFGAPVKAHHHPTFQTFVAAAMVVALVAMLVSAIWSVFTDWNWHEQPEEETYSTRPSRHTGNDHKDDALDRVHAKVVVAGYKSFFYGFPWIVLGLAWVATIL